MPRAIRLPIEFDVPVCVTLSNDNSTRTVLNLTKYMKKRLVEVLLAKIKYSKPGDEEAEIAGQFTMHFAKERAIIASFGIECIGETVSALPGHAQSTGTVIAVDLTPIHVGPYPREPFGFIKIGPSGLIQEEASFKMSFNDLVEWKTTAAPERVQLLTEALMKLIDSADFQDMSVVLTPKEKKIYDAYATFLRNASDAPQRSNMMEFERRRWASLVQRTFLSESNPLDVPYVTLASEELEHGLIFSATAKTSSKELAGREAGLTLKVSMTVVLPEIEHSAA